MWIEHKQDTKKGQFQIEETLIHYCSGLCEVMVLLLSLIDPLLWDTNSNCIETKQID